MVYKGRLSKLRTSVSPSDSPEKPQKPQGPLSYHCNKETSLQSPDIIKLQLRHNIMTNDVHSPDAALQLPGRQTQSRRSRGTEAMSRDTLHMPNSNSSHHTMSSASHDDDDDKLKQKRGSSFAKDGEQLLMHFPTISDRQLELPTSSDSQDKSPVQKPTWPMQFLTIWAKSGVG